MGGSRLLRIKASDKSLAQYSPGHVSLYIYHKLLREGESEKRKEEQVIFRGSQKLLWGDNVSYITLSVRVRPNKKSD